MTIAMYLATLPQPQKITKPKRSTDILVCAGDFGGVNPLVISIRNKDVCHGSVSRDALE